MGVTLYTSRIVLQQLGISDYGIYSLVGGIVTMLGFFNGAMASATQRYLSFDIGKGDFDRLKKTFSAALSIHFFIAIVVLVLAESIGLWYINNKMVYPENRLLAVNIVYQFSILTFILNIIQVPYNALIIARERMNIYAYVSILEAVLKLAIVFLLILASDKLILYSILTFIVAFVVRLIYQIYCRKQFAESKYIFIYDRNYYKELLSYSGWNLFGNVAAVSRTQGVNIVLNVFFGTVVNAAYGIAMQVHSAVNVFINNFQVAVNPQIIKSYSQNNLQRAHKLIFQSSKYSFFLMLLIASPILLNTEFVLQIWLKNPPTHTTLFVQLCLINVLIDCVSGPLMTGAQATGKIKWYQIIVGTLVFLNLPLSFLVLRWDGAPHSVFIVSILISLVSLQFRLFFLKRTLDLNVTQYYKKVICRIVLIVALFYFSYLILNKCNVVADDFITFLWHSAIAIFAVIGVVLFFGVNREERRIVMGFILKRSKYGV